MGSGEPCARSVVSPCRPVALAHLFSGTGRSGCFSAAGHEASAGSRTAAGTAGSAGRGGKPWEAQREPGMAPSRARTRRTQGHTGGTQHPSAQSDPGVTAPCTPTRPATSPRPAHRQARLAAQRWAHCSAEPRSGGGGGSAGTGSSSVARRRWKSLRGERWPGERGRGSACPWGHGMDTRAPWSVGSVPHGAGGPCPMEQEGPSAPVAAP